MARLICLLLCFCLSNQLLQAHLKGKIDIGATYVHVDFLESGKKTDSKNMKGVKGDLTLLVYKALYVKPGFILAWDRGKLASSVAVGSYIPLKDYLKVLPHVGMTFGYLSTKIDNELIGLKNKKERFRSVGPFIGFEVCLTLAKKWTFTAIYQYAWSRTHTKIKSFLSSKDHSSGSNYSFGLEYALNDQWAINGGVGYNQSLSDEKHGIRAKGGKIGLGYYF